MRLVFFGTPEFAVPALRALIGEGFVVVGVVTQPDRPQGRSRSRTIAPPVKQLAVAEQLPVLQPEHPNTPEAMESIRSLDADLGVVVAYGHLLKPELLSIPRLGMINVHASLLPALRGAAPIQHALLNGDSETGVSIMQMDPGMDSGPVILRVSTPIPEDETGGELQMRLAEIGALALVEAMTLIELGKASWEPQDHTLATFAPKITRDTAHIDWTRPAAHVACRIRAMDPAPGAWTTLNDAEVKCFGPAMVDREGAAGEILATAPDLIVGTGAGAVTLAELQPAGRKRISAAEWIRGRGAVVGHCFG